MTNGVYAPHAVGRLVSAETADVYCRSICRDPVLAVDGIPFLMTEGRIVRQLRTIIGYIFGS